MTHTEHAIFSVHTKILWAHPIHNTFFDPHLKFYEPTPHTTHATTLPVLPTHSRQPLFVRLKNILQFYDKVRPTWKADKKKKCKAFQSVNAFYYGQEWTLNAHKKIMFSLKSSKIRGYPSDLAKPLKLLTPK